MIGITNVSKFRRGYLCCLKTDMLLLESALNQQINEMERRHPNYDEYQYNIAEIGHNPYHLISYLTAKYGDWTYSDVENELQSLFEAQYHLNTEGRTETVTETRNVRVGESFGTGSDQRIL